jgi:ankyrin repeat protein
VADLTVHDVEARKRRRAEAVGAVVDLTTLPSDSEEEQAVARGAALRAKRAAAESAKTRALKLQPLLFDAAEAGDAAEISRLLKRGADACAADGDDGSTALHFAARGGHVKAVEALLDAGASALCTDQDDVTPVHDAIVAYLEGNDPDFSALTSLLLKLQPGNGRALVFGDDSPLCFALRACGGDVDAALNLVKLLVARGCGSMDYPAIRDVLRPAVLMARDFDDSALLQYMRGSPVYLRHSSFDPDCVLAYDDDSVSDIEAIYSAMFSWGCCKGHVTLSFEGKVLDKDECLGFYQLPVRELDLEASPHRDGCVHIVSDAVVDFFHAVCDGKVAELARCVKDDHGVEIDLDAHDCFGLIEDHAPERSDCPDKHWCDSRDARPTALWDAVHMGRASMVNKLLSLGADVNTCLLVDDFPAHTFAGECQDKAEHLGYGGETALHAAARLRSTEIASALLKAGANVNERCGAEHRTRRVAGATPLYWAVRCGNVAMVKLLLANGADPCAECVSTSGPKMSATDPSGAPVLLPMLLAAVLRSRHESKKASDGAGTSRSLIIGALIAAGADVNLRTAAGSTPLMLAARYAPLAIAVLLRHDPDVAAVDMHGKTALHVAAEHDQVAVIDALLVAGADLGARDASGNTPLATAMACGQSAAVSRLSAVGLPDTVRARRRLTE